MDGEVLVDRPLRSLSDLPGARATLFDVTPRQLIDICGDRLPSTYRRRLERFRYGPGVFKIDWALSDPVPWKAEGCTLAGTVHLGGRYDEIVESEAAIAAGRHPERPYMVTAQQSLFDPSRAPEGGHTFWGYCHVPNGSTVDMTERMERQIERFAPGFRDVVVARHVMPPAALEAHDANYVGGDINGGAADLRQLFTRPVATLDPYSTPADGIYICSSSTPPGGGVHGMCGYLAARSALKHLGVKGC
jgi:phytoene dehydrogenase-like protein